MPRDGRLTRERILTTAQRLVIDNGMAATSVDEVIAASRSSKGAFFHHFESKRALAEALVDRYVAADIDSLHEALHHSRTHTDDPVERVIAFVRYFENTADDLMSDQSSCLYISILTERDLVAGGVSDPISKAVIAWREGFAELLRAAVDTRPGVDHDIDIDALADHVFVTFEGAFLLARSTGDPGHMRAQLRTLRVLLTALLT